MLKGYRGYNYRLAEDYSGIVHQNIDAPMPLEELIRAFLPLAGEMPPP
jgi:hypothetical protein